MALVRAIDVLERQAAGSSHSARSGLLRNRPDGTVLLAIAVILLGGMTPLLEGPRATSIACAMMLVIGLPHGALDIATIRRGSIAVQMKLLVAYLAAGTAMFAIWAVSPITALAIFYTAAMVHFASDWRDTTQPFFAHAVIVAMLSLPALTHTIDLDQLFVALTNDRNAARLVDILLLAAPVASAISIVGLATISDRRRAFDGVCALSAMLILPPVVGFAVFFCLFHSPRHFREGWVALGPKVAPDIAWSIAAATLGGFVVAAIIFMLSSSERMPPAALEVSMVTLSVLTVPHMLLPMLDARLRH